MQSLYFPFSKNILIKLALFFAFIVGVSGLLIPSLYSALYIGVILCSIPILYLWIKQPVFALYGFLLYSFLPYGLVPPTVYYYLNRLFPIAVLALWLLGLIIHHDRIIFNITTFIMSCFLIWSVVTLFWITNVSIGISFLQIYFVRFVTFLLLIPNLIRTQRNFDGLMTTLAISAWVIVMACVVAVLITGYLPGMRLKVFGENENEIGILILVTMVGVYWKALQPLKSNLLLWKLLAYIYVFAAIIIIAMSGSRGSIISLLITFLAFWFWKPTRSLGKVGLICLIAIGMIAPYLFNVTFERFSIIDQTNTFLGGREALWSAAWLYIRNSPWIGVGIGNSNYELLSYLRLFRSTLGLKYASVHNPVLTIWVETGIPGVLLYLSSLISALVLFVQQYFKNKKNLNVYLQPYFYIVSSIFLGFMASWIKGGGIESNNTYFLVLGLLLIPSSLGMNQTKN